MYRYGDGTPFPLDENFIETLTTAVESCTEAFVPLADLDDRRKKAAQGRQGGDREITKLGELEKSVTANLAQFIAADKKLGGATSMVAEKLVASAKTAVAEAKRAVEGRVQTLEGQAAPKTSTDDVIRALSVFFDAHQAPKAEWIMSWDVRGNEPQADALMTAGRLSAQFALAIDNWRAPIRVEQLAEGITVHMMKKGVFGKAKPAPIDLGKHVIVAYERTAKERVLTLRESQKVAAGLRFAITDAGATWVSITPGGDAEGEASPLDAEDIAPVRKLADAINEALKGLIEHRRLTDLSLGGVGIGELPEPRAVPFELLLQLTPYARSIREKSRASGELVLKRDLGDGRREELFVPRATLSQHFARLPAEYRKPFEEMGITSEDTQPSIVMTRAPARPSHAPTLSDEPTIEVDKGKDD